MPIQEPLLTLLFVKVVQWQDSPEKVGVVWLTKEMVKQMPE